VKVLIDTNVLVSAALRNGLPELVVIFVATQNDLKWLMTPEILDEYVGVLSREKFSLTRDTINDWKRLLELRTVTMRNPPPVSATSRDPKDVPFLAAAIDSAADFLITGDRDLLDAQLSLSTRIVTVAEFAAQFQVT
jgi:putative PIN family toxin of toxin-antitoxin system